MTLCLPKNASEERKRILKAYGVEIIYTDPAEGSDGALRKAHELYAAAPEKYFYANQYGNDANWRAHYRGTANEIWEQTDERVTHFVGHARHQRNLRGDQSQVEGTQSKDPLHFVAAGFRLPWHRGREAYGDSHRASHL